MSKVGQWILGMQEDATWMSRAVFINVYGIHQVDIWDKIQSGEDENWEPDFALEMDDGA